jgi:iron(II)-dependent oxidoreductase
VRELYDVGALRAALIDARNYTLALYAHLSPGQMRFPYLRIVNPPLWELAHIGWFQEHWCLRWREGSALPPARLADADPTLNSALIPHAARWELPQLTHDAVHAYLAHEFQDTLAALDSTPPDRLYFFLLSLFHEDMHGEALLTTLQTLGFPEPQLRRPVLPRPAAAPTARGKEIEFAGGSMRIGATLAGDFVFDNEKWEHAVDLEPFALSATQVSNADLASFVEAGGYEDQRLWSEAGWTWRMEHDAHRPPHWQREDGTWLVRRFDRWEALAADEPAVHVNAYEAEAYCRFVGRRLPTEAEWEYAARSGLAPGADRYPWGGAPARHGEVNLGGAFGRPVPVSSLPDADTPTGLRQMLGNVWEWTSTAFEPYPGFAADPYQEYSQPWFHDHRVLRGGCFATGARLVHNRWRNFYRPERNDIFSGLRTARTLRA